MKSKNIVTVFMLAALFLTVGCDNSLFPRGENGDIEENYPPNGNEDKDSISALLVGSWNVVQFAYTSDGKTISKITDVSPPSVNRGTQNIVRISEISSDEWRNLYERLSYYWAESPWVELPPFDERVSLILGFRPDELFYSISDNLLNFNLITSDILVLVTYTDEEHQILHALQNTHNFVVKENELMIYFTGLEDKNLLILRRREL